MSSCAWLAQILGVEGAGAHLDAVPRPQVGGGARERLGVAAEEVEVVAPARQGGGGAPGDGRGGAEDEDRVVHRTSSRRRARSEARRPSGSTRRFTARNRSQPGYMARKVLGAHARVLGEVEPAPAVEDHAVEALEEVQGLLAGHGDVEGVGVAGHGEREELVGLLGAEALEHREEARHVGLGAGLQDLPEPLAAAVLGDHQLVLEEALRAVEPVPVVDDVEGEEVLVVVLDVAPGALRVLEVEGRVERGDRRGVEEARGGRQGHRGGGPADDLERVPGAAAGEARGGEPVAPQQHPAPQVPAPGQGVDPGDRVGVLVVGVVEPVEGLLEVGGPVDVHGEVGALDALELQAHPLHDAGEAHAPQRRPEELGVLGAADGDPLAAREHQAQLEDVAGGGAGDVVVLPVDVAGDQPAEGHLGGPRDHRGEQAPRHQEADEGVEAQPRLHLDLGGVLVELEDAVEAAGEHRAPVAGEGGVAVAAPEAPGDDVAHAGEGAGELGHRLRAHHLGARLRVAAPAGEDVFPGSHVRRSISPGPRPISAGGRGRRRTGGG